MPATMNDASASRKRILLACAGLTGTAFFWATNAVLGRATVGEIPPISLAFWRWVTALIILAPIGIPAVIRQWPTVKRHWRAMVVLAALSVGLFNTLLYVAAQTTTALNIALMNASLPIALGLAAHFTLGERLDPIRGLGIALGFFGILTIITEADPMRLLRLEFVPGDLVMLGAVASWSTFSVVLRRQAVPLSAAAFLTVQIALGIPVVAPFYIAEISQVGLQLPNPANFWIFLTVAVGPGLLAYTFWNNGVRTIGASRAALFLYLIPVFAAILGYIFLGERLAAFHAVGGVFILAGLLLASRRQRSPAGGPGQGID